MRLFLHKFSWLEEGGWYYIELQINATLINTLWKNSKKAEGGYAAYSIGQNVAAAPWTTMSGHLVEPYWTGDPHLPHRTTVRYPALELRSQLSFPNTCQAVDLLWFPPASTTVVPQCQKDFVDFALVSHWYEIFVNRVNRKLSFPTKVHSSHTEFWGCSCTVRKNTPGNVAEKR